MVQIGYCTRYQLGIAPAVAVKPVARAFQKKLVSVLLRPDRIPACLHIINTRSRLGSYSLVLSLDEARWIIS